MRRFLDEVASALYGTYGECVSDLQIVFPGKRARLFFNESLLQLTGDRPLWQPAYRSMDELIRDCSPLEVAEPLRLVAELYPVYRQHHAGESFDRFYRWGELLLADFDRIDKYRIDARALYANVSDLKEIDAHFSSLFNDQDDDQRNESLGLVREFWNSLGRGAVRSAEQQHFLGVWRSLYPIYTAYRERLAGLGIAYPGMIYREVADRLDDCEPDPSFAGKHFCFVGFNALNSCEQLLFDHLKRHGLADFFWDYDDYFLDGEHQEAGRFIRRNIVRFGSDGSFDHRNFEQPKQIEVIATPSDLLQCKVLYDELEKIHRRQGYLDKETAIVLTDESLLLPLLHSLPPLVERLNVTMGYPLSDTVPYALFERLVALQGQRDGDRFNHTETIRLLSHPYLVEAEPGVGRYLAEIEQRQYLWVPASLFSDHPLLGRIFRPVDTPAAMNGYLHEVLGRFGAVESGTLEARQRKEFIYQILLSLDRLEATAAQCSLELSMGVYLSLVRQALGNQRIPYEGEPLSGLQVMGILETRNLDFKNVLLLSLADDTFPGNREGASYVPFNLRQAFGLPTPQDHEAMYAYYFYRLIARCESLTLMYSSAADGQRTGEQSRYLYQLEYESPHAIRRSNINLRVEVHTPPPIRIEKDDRLMARLWGMNLSPSRVNRYITCPLQFYFAEVERLRPDDRPLGQITPFDRGNLLHRAMELLYTPLVGKPDAREAIAALTPARIEQAVSEAMAMELGARSGEVDQLGRLRMERDTVLRYVRDIVSYDARLPHAYTVEALEREVERTVELAPGRSLKLCGKADRIDRLADGTLRVIDYKSGGDKTDYRSLEELMLSESARQGDDRLRGYNNAVLQLFLYAWMLDESGAGCRPALYTTRDIALPGFSPEPVGKEPPALEDGRVTAPLLQAVEGHLHSLLIELFDQTKPFVQTTHEKSCAWCDFRLLCGRSAEENGNP